MELLLSIIVPVYNVENYIDECFKSIADQITESCEVIFVDDGSTDSSGGKCDLYKSNSVRVIHKENGGLSSARNAGLAVAEGRYIAFLDSDDRLSNDSIQRIMDWIKSHNCDVCFLDAIKFYPDGSEISLGDCIIKEEVEDKQNEEVLMHLASRPKFPGSSCTKIYSREFLEANNITFPNDRRTSEDLWFVTECLIHAHSFGCIEGPYYEYRQNRIGSITNIASKKSVLSLFNYVRYYSDFFCENHIPTCKRYEYAMSFVAYEYIQLIIDANNYCIEDSLLKKSIKDYKWTMKYGLNKRIKAVKLLSDIVGITITGRILAFYLAARKQ